MPLPMMGRMNREICMRMRAFFVLAIFAASTCGCLGITTYTDPRDVEAISDLYIALGHPPLSGWSITEVDPCLEPNKWQGVECVFYNITGIILSGANLTGELSQNLGNFTSLIELDLSNNHIGGSIPPSLPTTIQTFSLAGNHLIGSIPDTISTLGLMTDLNLSGNNLSGQLPPSMGNLPSLTTLDLHNNQLSGFLDVLQGLPLINLNIENNLFFGPIPEELKSIQNFSKDGNPFNTTVIPSPPTLQPSPAPTLPSSPSPSPIGAPQISPNVAYGEVLFPPQLSIGEKNDGEHKSISKIVIGGLVILVVLLCVCLLALSNFCKRSRNKGHKAFHALPSWKTPIIDQYMQKPDSQAQKVKRNETPGAKDQGNNSHMSLALNESGWTKHTRIKSSWSEKDDDSQLDILPQPPSPYLTLPSERIIQNAKIPPISTTNLSSSNMSSESCYKVADLQQYTNSFSQYNLIGKGMLGSVYKGHLPTGELLAVKKLDNDVTKCQNDEELLKLICTISGLRHDNIVQFMGYSIEHGQRLLVYEYCDNGSLYEALHVDEEMHRQLSWNVRVRIALEAARALEYMHEVCHHPTLHRNFQSVNVLLDLKLTVHISDCGLAALVPSKSMAVLQGCGYGAPELELGSYTCQSDIYSFGVVLLELLTGRKSYDGSRPQGEQFLVRWAVTKLHDIDALSRMVDPSLAGKYPSKSLSRFADIISLCIQPEPEFRPPMSEIVQSLLHMM
ncbi:unnamed protein product [Cuscuta epithymum]|uniref:Protein kinase domain-containing protein n=2 Tax=Cuscuta epithymum TaxID=186058 RepID=A0AAV0DY42_9ASTE|nr:unnamed protein product [Cuscuta epithymum]